MPSHSPIYDASVQLLAPLEAYVPVSVLRWTPPVTPLSDAYTASAVIVAYLATIFGLRSVLRTIKARQVSSPTNDPAHQSTKGAANPAEAQRKRRPLPVIPASLLKYPFLLHNVLLSAGSGWLLALILEEVLPIYKRNGAYYSICGEGAWTMVSCHASRDKNFRDYHMLRPSFYSASRHSISSTTTSSTGSSSTRSSSSSKRSPWVSSEILASRNI